LGYFPLFVQGNTLKDPPAREKEKLDGSERTHGDERSFLPAPLIGIPVFSRLVNYPFITPVPHKVAISSRMPTLFLCVAN